jgi:DNA ligase D-like protein (predicted ligase)/DNA ligase D-like protein (predicted 3'-phosphoesterase)
MTRSHTYRPMLARLAQQPFSGKDWLFEIKWDGFRAIAYVNQALSLRSRNQKELKYTFPELEELTQLTRNVVLDGEIVLVKEGKPDFQALLERRQATSPVEIELQAKRSPVVYVVFDILEKSDVSLANLPLTERKRILKDSVKEGKHVVLSDFVEEKGEDYYHVALEKGLEGIVAKRKDSVYESGARSDSWLKIKKLRSCDCVIFGYTKGSGARSESFGALLLGLYDGEKSVYVGKVGTGFSQALLQTLSERFKQLKTDKPLFESDITDEITWLKPELVCEIGYQVVTRDVRLRMPRFLGLREDKLPSECTLDQIIEGGLEEYRSKRDFSVTAEPVGGGEKVGGKIFVVQEHHSRRLHYDLRLEKDGVLKSWAVPKGIPADPNEKRLAVATEDHPLGYAAFEGVIPKGQYGAGTVKIWDKGVYEAKVWDEKMIEFTVQGEKLKGRYVLVRLKKAGEKSWLLLKGKEKHE